MKIAETTTRRQVWPICSALIVLVLVAGGCGPDESESRYIKGAWLVEHGGKDLLSKEATASLKRLRAMGVKWLAIGPEVHMEDIHRPEFRFGHNDDYNLDWIARARAAGFKIMLLPRIESPAFFKPPHPFRADIEMKSQGDWLRFFANYQAMLMHFARMAEENRVELLCIGLEYRKCVQASPEQWRKFAGAVRKVYSGKLTYSANWWKEFEEVSFWDALDYIGIGAYFEIGDRESAGLFDLVDGWRPVLTRLSALSRRTGKKILFTETGYPTYADAGQHPWKWQFDTSRALDPQQQAACFEAMFRNLVPSDWFAGLFIWRFYTWDRYVEPWEYTPEGKPAEAVIRRWYRH